MQGVSEEREIGETGQFGYKQEELREGHTKDGVIVMT